MKKTTTFKIIALAAALSTVGSAYASDFGLDGFSAADIRAGRTDFKAPAAPKPETGDDMIGLDMNIRVPFKMLRNAVVQVSASGKRLTIIDQNAPVMSKAGDFLKISNLRVDANGIIVTPTLTLKPYIEGRDKLAIRVQRVQLHASMEPSVKVAPAAINQEDIMAQVMDVMIKGVYAALDKKLQAKQIPLKAEEVVSMKYDKAAWTLHAAVSSKIMREFIPAGLMGELHLTGFTFNETGLNLKIQTAK